MMRSQFEEDLKVTGGNVDAKGTLDWGPEEEKAVVDVTILQEWQPGTLTKVGTGKAVFMRTADSQPWELQASSGSGSTSLVPEKKALAMGVVCALGTNIEMRQFTWCQEIDLIP